MNSWRNWRRGVKNEKRMAQVEGFKAKLYENLVGGILTKEEFLSYKRKYNVDIELLQKAVAEWNEKLAEQIAIQGKEGISYELYRSIQRTHHVYFSRLLQSRYTQCSYYRMA